MWNAHYYQDDVPVRELSVIAGHAVRAMYLYCGMADVAAYTGDTGLTDALDRLWDHVVLKNMYITGGIGQSARNEGITEDYDLPNLSAYCETCASVGMLFWNWRMNQFTGDAKYADVMERSMYNGALAGINLSGKRFFYVNPLESLGNHHRQVWYGCACCPSQICRFLPSIGNYIYGVSDKALWVNLYMGNTASVKLGGKESVKTQLRLRIPGWCRQYAVSVNGTAVEPVVEKGYAVLDGKWKDGDVIDLEMAMPVEVVAADPRVKEDEGKRAVQRGPLVYCIEEADNPTDFDRITIHPDADWQAGFDADFLSGVVRIGDGSATYIPYYAWDNRSAGKMKVWIPLND